MDKLLEYKEKISAKLERYEKIVELEKQTGVDKFYIFCVGALLAGILLFVVGGEELVVGLVGFIYPAYMSFKAINTPGTGDDTQWLTYWVVYAFFNLTESITDLVLSWIPFYFFFKIAFLVWSYHPTTQGSSIIYNSLIKPYVAPHVGQIDSALKRGEEAAKSVAAKIQEKTQ
ncbi:ER membrane protein DP1/Yop1 [Phytophthora cinnamomi]|uniref:ER membrane protein DP1/Yop1 n=1 Tax=Phytophthora cinnamomi TaxID=4785 RepID=UPI00355A28A5|nr:ER membrane protein DP1/Yop1 [Phytophthora cinnamomi]KAG6613379.1 ER membrane protein DP1/Yop1 [Phytophthora cinnamomi]